MTDEFDKRLLYTNGNEKNGRLWAERPAGVKGNIKSIDSETVDKKLTEFYMQQMKDKLESLKVQHDSLLCF